MACDARGSAFDDLRRAFARRTGTEPEDWFLVFKARYGMREVFRSLHGVHGSGEVVTTLFTGCTAVDSIISAGLRPVYAPINDGTLGMDASALAAHVGEATRAVLWQHSYGLIDERACAEAVAVAHGAGCIFVEDSAHCLARLARDEDGRPLADVSVHSFGIEKAFSNLYFGGAIWVSPAMADADARDRIVGSLSSLADLPSRLDAATRHYRSQVRILTRLPGQAARIMRGRMLARGSYEPPVADIERRGGLPYDSYLPSEWIVRQIMSMFALLDEDESRRVACVRAYREALGGLRVPQVPAAALGPADEQPLIRFPVRFSDEGTATESRRRLLSSGFYAVDWYRVPFYPGALDIGAYGVSRGAYDAYCARYGGTIGLPCDIEPDRVDSVVGIVRAMTG